MRMEEFLEGADGEAEDKPLEAQEEEAVAEVEELDVQKAVVEALAAEKAEMGVKIEKLEKELEEVKGELSKERADAAQARLELVKATNGDLAELKAENEKLKAKVAEQAEILAKTGDILTANAEPKEANKVALIDRSLEIGDRFPGETRDHVIEAIRDARNAAEADGRIRKAQLLESVLVENEPSGELERRRKAMEKFFNENANIVSGPVIEKLEKSGIAYKTNDGYLLPSEILKRTY